MKHKNTTVGLILVVVAIVVASWVFWGNKTAEPMVDNSGTTKIDSEIPVSITTKKIIENNFSGSVPVITGTSSSAIEAQKYIDQTIADFKTRADTEVPDMKAEFGPNSPPATYSIDITADYQKSTKTESIIISEYVYTGGANGMSIYKVFTNSLETGNILSLSDMIKPEKRDAFVSLVKQKLLVWTPYGVTEPVVFPDEVNKLTFDSFTNWSLDGLNLNIYFDKYDIGPGALGAVVFPIPLADIQDFLVAPIPVAENSILGCYVARLSKDVYTLRIENEGGEIVSGRLSYNNFGKDSSSGVFSGTYKDGILMGDYTFDSEGMHSVRQVIFKTVDDSFVQGFGPADVKNDREYLLDPENVVFGSDSVFKKEDCGS